MRTCVSILLLAAGACTGSPAPQVAQTPTPSTRIAVDAAVPDADPSARRVVWANIETTKGCFYFAGPFDHGTESSYRDHARLVRDGQILELRLGDTLFRGLESVDGYVLSRTSEYKQPEATDRWATTETISGDFDSRQAFRGRFSYEECKIGAAECPGPCKLTADLIVR